MGRIVPGEGLRGAGDAIDGLPLRREEATQSTAFAGTWDRQVAAFQAHGEGQGRGVGENPHRHLVNRGVVGMSVFTFAVVGHHQIGA